MDLLKLKQKAKNLQPILRIGKNGVNDNVINEVNKLLKKRNIIKIKILNNCPVEDTNEIIDEIINTCNAVLVRKIGNTFSIYKENNKKN